MARSSREAAKRRTRTVGFVCEGSTDVVVLRRVVEQVLGDVDARSLQPVVDRLDRQAPGGKSGWSEVRAWCKRVTSLDEYFHPDIGEPLGALVIVIPVMALEAWVLAALFPRMGRAQLEEKPALVLVEKKKISMGRRGPWKRAIEYERFAQKVAKNLGRVRNVCPEADRFVTKLERLARALP